MIPQASPPPHEPPAPPRAAPPAATPWRAGRFTIDVRTPRVMGIVNVTPDSFSDGGRHADAAQAIAHARQLVDEGADILDIGGESTRPDARPPGVDEELARVLPVVEAAVGWGVPVSVDTSAPEVMRAALDAGADIVNDVRSLQRPGALEVLAAHPSAGVCLMHMRGEPSTMMAMTDYGDVVDEVARWLDARRAALRDAGIAADRIALDPGFGFAKRAPDNVRMLARLDAFAALGAPLLVGLSRKSSLGVITGRPVGERLAASLASALAAVARGAGIVRVHDVAATVDALKVWRAAALPPFDAG